MEMLVMLPSPAFWHNKRVLLTGHTGFKGAWLALWLQRLGATVTGLALPPQTQPNLFDAAGIANLCDSHFGDIRGAQWVRERIHAARPDIVLHLAAQALVRTGYEHPVETFGSNLMGTVHVLDALRGQADLRVAVMVTTDKVYRNLEHAYPYRETDALGGYDPYSASKATCELAVASYRDSYLKAQGVAVATARAGNVIGGGDWSADRLIPDAVRAWSHQQSLELRNPASTRPWQHVLEPLCAYLRLAECLWQTPGVAAAYNFGPETTGARSVGEVVELASAAFGSGTWHSPNQATGPHEAGQLALEVALAQHVLGVRPRWTVAEAVARSMHWYRDFAQGCDARTLCANDMAAYEACP